MHGNHLGALPLVTLRWQGIKELGWKETFSTKIQYNSHRIKKKRAGSNINPESTLIKYQCSVIWENRSNSAGSQNYNAVVATEESLKLWPWDVWRMSSERCSHVVVVFSAAAVSHWTMMNVITACTLLNEPIQTRTQQGEVDAGSSYSLMFLHQMYDSNNIFSLLLH